MTFSRSTGWQCCGAGADFFLVGAGAACFKAAPAPAASLRQAKKQGCGSGSAWIQEGKFVNYKLKKCKEIANNCNFIRFFKVNLYKLHCFLLLGNLLCFLQL